MKMKSLSAVMLLAILSFSIISCDKEESAEPSCNEKATTYNDALKNLSDFLDSEEDATCEDYQAIMTPFEEAYVNLCEESKTTELTQSYTEVTAVVYLIAALDGCEL